MLNDGLYTRFPKPNFALGFHDNAQMEIGQIGVTPGYTYANVDSVDVTVHGVGGHGAYPHKTKYPVVLSAEIINMWQTIASREINPIDPVVVTVGSIHGGTKHNIISDEVKMQLTVRTYKKEVRDQVLAAIARIAKGCAIAGGWPEDKLPDVKVREDEFTPSTYNNPELTTAAGRRLEEIVRRKERRDHRPDDGRRGFLRIQSAGSFDSGGRLSCRCSFSGKDRGFEETGCTAAAQSAFEQVRSGPGADHSHRPDRDDKRGARPNEKVGPLVISGEPAISHAHFCADRSAHRDPGLPRLWARFFRSALA